MVRLPSFAVYAGIVAALSLALPSGDARPAAIVAALIVAIGFAPLRALLQRIVDRAFFGTRSTPVKAATRLSEGLAITDDLTSALESTRQELALHASLLASELELSRAAIVTAREEERRMLHRELHDGLGPVLTGAGFRADAVSNVIDADPMAAKAMLKEVRGDILSSALADVRRVVYGVRPLDLEELGLVGALTHRTTGLRGRDGAPIQVSIDASGDLETLPAATQLAAYRIVIEAVTNVSRHSHATHCTVTLATDGGLLIEVLDDGPSRGSRWAVGAGISSVVERAAELGGTASAGPTAAGGRVSARLPLG